LAEDFQMSRLGRNVTVKTVSVVIAGFPRCPQFSLPRLAGALERNLSPLPYKFDLRYHLILGTESEGANRDELVETLAKTSTDRMGVYVKTYTDQPSSFGTAEMERRSSRLRNPYPRRPRKSVNNHLRLLGLLAKVMPELDSDVNIFVRADLVAIGPIDLGSYISLAHDSIVTPSWHTWGGVNDRVAVVPQHLTAKYFGRLSGAGDLLRSGQPIHGETFLARALEGTPVRAVMEDKFARTTPRGGVRQENFSQRRHRLRKYLIVFEDILRQKTSAWRRYLNC
jgi:hypothetical protein